MTVMALTTVWSSGGMGLFRSHNCVYCVNSPLGAALYVRKFGMVHISTWLQDYKIILWPA